MQNQEHQCNIHHYVPQVYLRSFTSSFNTKQKSRLKIYWKDKRGFDGNDYIKNVCQMHKYNTSEQEMYLGKDRENPLSDSLKSVINNSHNDDDIYNVKKLISYIYTDNPGYRQRIINDAKNSVIKHFDLYKYADINFVFDDDIKGKAHITITAAIAMTDTIINWEYEIICFDNQLITSDSPVSIVSKNGEITEFSQMEIDPNIETPNIIIEDMITKRRKLHVNHGLVNITKMSFPEDTCIYTPLSPKIGMFLFSSKEAEDKFKDELEKMSARNYPFYEALNLGLYAYCNDYILGHKQELLNDASEYVRIQGYTQKFSTKERKEQRIRKGTMIDF